MVDNADDSAAFYCNDSNRLEGRIRSLASEPNRIFARNGIAFNLGDGGRIERLAPESLRTTLAKATFDTPDAKLNDLLESSRAKFLNADLEVRREGLEKLWDAFERFKTVLPGKDKKATAMALACAAAPEAEFRERLEVEMKALTDIGNQFLIRHSETTQTEIVHSEHVDYLYHRLFAAVDLFLAAIRS